MRNHVRALMSCILSAGLVFSLPSVTYADWSDDVVKYISDALGLSLTQSFESDAFQAFYDRMAANEEVSGDMALSCSLEGPSGGDFSLSFDGNFRLSEDYLGLYGKAGLLLPEKDSGEETVPDETESVTESGSGAWPMDDETEAETEGHVAYTYETEPVPVVTQIYFPLSGSDLYYQSGEDVQAKVRLTSSNVRKILKTASFPEGTFVCASVLTDDFAGDIYSHDVTSEEANALLSFIASYVKGADFGEDLETAMAFRQKDLSFEGSAGKISIYIPEQAEYPSRLVWEIGPHSAVIKADGASYQVEGMNLTALFLDYVEDTTEPVLTDDMKLLVENDGNTAILDVYEEFDNDEYSTEKDGYSSPPPYMRMDDGTLYEMTSDGYCGFSFGPFGDYSEFAGYSQGGSIYVKTPSDSGLSITCRASDGKESSEQLDEDWEYFDTNDYEVRNKPVGSYSATILSYRYNDEGVYLMQDCAYIDVPGSGCFVVEVDYSGDESNAPSDTLIDDVLSHAKISNLSWSGAK